MFFANGFRPFFFGAGAWAVASLFVWLWVYFGSLNLGTSFDPLSWHLHEMIFGYACAVIAGFLLTAVPNWTGMKPVSGRPLAGLFLIWVLGRLAIVFSGLVPAILVALVDISFMAVLLVMIARAIVKAGNRRNLVVVFLIALFVLANGLMHAGVIWGVETSSLGGRLGLSVVVLLVTLIGGRIIPNFTQNWLRREGGGDIKTGVTGVDRATMAATVLAFGAWAAMPYWQGSGVLFAVCGAVGLVRLSQWGALRTFNEPLVTILHVAYLWMPIGAFLLAASFVVDGLTQATALHGFTIGGIGTMTLAVMTRATLGHTGRPLTADSRTIAIFGLITLAAIVRVGSALGPDPLTMTAVSGLAWIGAFLMFLWSYGPMFFLPRAD